MHARKFSAAFGGSHGSERSAPYDAARHVTRYAASNPGEDFAEVFMKYLEHGGRIHRRFRDRPALVLEWNFVRDLGRAIRAGQRRW